VLVLKNKGVYPRWKAEILILFPFGEPEHYNISQNEMGNGKLFRYGIILTPENPRPPIISYQGLSNSFFFRSVSYGIMHIEQELITMARNRSLAKGYVSLSPNIAITTHCNLAPAAINHVFLFSDLIGFNFIKFDQNRRKEYLLKSRRNIVELGKLHKLTIKIIFTGLAGSNSKLIPGINLIENDDVDNEDIMERENLQCFTDVQIYSQGKSKGLISRLSVANAPFGQDIMAEEPDEARNDEETEPTDLAVQNEASWEPAGPAENESENGDTPNWTSDDVDDEKFDEEEVFHQLNTWVETYKANFGIKTAYQIKHSRIILVVLPKIMRGNIRHTLFCVCLTVKCVGQVIKMSFVGDSSLYNKHPAYVDYIIFILNAKQTAGDLELRIPVVGERPSMTYGVNAFHFKNLFGQFNNELPICIPLGEPDENEIVDGCVYVNITGLISLCSITTIPGKSTMIVECSRHRGENGGETRCECVQQFGFDESENTNLVLENLGNGGIKWSSVGALASFQYIDYELKRLETSNFIFYKGSAYSRSHSSVARFINSKLHGIIPHFDPYSSYEIPDMIVPSTNLNCSCGERVLFQVGLVSIIGENRDAPGILVKEVGVYELRCPTGSHYPIMADGGNIFLINSAFGIASKYLLEASCYVLKGLGMQTVAEIYSNIRSSAFPGTFTMRDAIKKFLIHSRLFCLFEKLNCSRCGTKSRRSITGLQEDDLILCKNPKVICIDGKGSLFIPSRTFPNRSYIQRQSSIAEEMDVDIAVEEQLPYCFEKPPHVPQKNWQRAKRYIIQNCLMQKPSEVFPESLADDIKSYYPSCLIDVYSKHVQIEDKSPFSMNILELVAQVVSVDIFMYHDLDGKTSRFSELWKDILNSEITETEVALLDVIKQKVDYSVQLMQEKSYVKTCSDAEYLHLENPFLNGFFSSSCSSFKPFKVLNVEESKAIQASGCSKNFGEHKSKRSQSAIFYLCNHGIPIAVSLNKHGKSVRHIAAQLISYFESPNTYIYDFSCGMRNSYVKLASREASASRFLIDTWHFKGHKCCSLYDSKSHRDFEFMNTLVSEQFNKQISCLQTTLMNCRLDTAMVILIAALVDIAERTRKNW
jgi:hypothetical protein